MWVVSWRRRPGGREGGSDFTCSCVWVSQTRRGSWARAFSQLYWGLLGWCESTVCEISDAALTVFTLKAAAVCTVHLSHYRSDSTCIWIICKILSKTSAAPYWSHLVVNERTSSAKKHKPCSAWHLTQETRRRLQCLEGFLKVCDLMSATDSLPSFLPLVLSSWSLTWASMRCIYL